MTLKDLTELKFKMDVKNRPSVPLHAVPRKTFTDKTANGLATAIKAFCDLQGVMCMRSGNEGRYRPGSSVVDVIGRTRVMKGTWLPGQNNGLADITIILKGMTHYVEIKIGKDRQSDVQKTFESMAKKAGASYDIAKSWNDFYKLYRSWAKSTNK
jgi:hypothetical protein